MHWDPFWTRRFPFFLDQNYETTSWRFSQFKDSFDEKQRECVRISVTEVGLNPEYAIIRKVSFQGITFPFWGGGISCNPSPFMPANYLAVFVCGWTDIESVSERTARTLKGDWCCYKTVFEFSLWFFCHILRHLWIFSLVLVPYFTSKISPLKDPFAVN